MNQNYNILQKIPCFVENEIETTNKYVVYQNRICSFLQQSTCNSSRSSQNCVSKNPISFPKFSPLGKPKSHRHDTKITSIQNSN